MVTVLNEVSLRSELRSALPVVTVGAGPPVGVVTIDEVVEVSLQLPNAAAKAFTITDLSVSTFKKALKSDGIKPESTKASIN